MCVFCNTTLSQLPRNSISPKTNHTKQNNVSCVPSQSGQNHCHRNLPRTKMSTFRRRPTLAACNRWAIGLRSTFISTLRITTKRHYGGVRSSSQRHTQREERQQSTVSRHRRSQNSFGVSLLLRSFHHSFAVGVFVIHRSE